MTRIFPLALAALLLGLVAGEPGAVPNPLAPTVEPGAGAGGARACYWVFGETDTPLEGVPSHYIGAIRGRVTALSPPACVDLPPGGQGGKRVLHLQPVPGVKRYHVLKTEGLPAPQATVTVRKRGNGALWYWVVAVNAWRRSPMSGPFPALNTEVDAPDNEIRVTPVPNATAYSYYVTRTPKPPLGRDNTGVAEFVGPTVTHTGGAAHVPAGFPPTPAEEPPSGYGNFLLGSTEGDTLEDTGQPLSRVLPPSLNETERQPLTITPDATGDSRNPLNALISLRPQVAAPLAPEPSFAWTGFYPVWLDTRVESGGVNHYQSPPAGGGNYKSTIGSMNLGLTSHTQSQYANLTGELTTYGMGDSIWLAPIVSVHGGTRDGGDEGTEILRSHIDRVAREAWLTLKADAPPGSVGLPVEGDLGEAGAGRTLLNAGQAVRKGRIEFVDNVMAYGRGTDWTPDMAGRWISFDVDSPPMPKEGPWSKITSAGGPGGGVRQWYEVDQVLSPTQLRFRAITGWSDHVNLGFSRFIRDPQTGKGPGTLYTNRLANFTLPNDRRAASEAGGYLLAPGTSLDDPYHQERTLRVEPLREAWKAGDALVVAAGPQTTVTQGWFVQFGDYMPQDVIQGLEVMNYGERTANGPGVHIGSEPSTPGWQVGLQVTLPDSGAGNGIVINGSKAREAAILAPPDLPALRFSETTAPWLQGDSATNSLLVKAPSGAIPLQVNEAGSVLNGRTRVNGALSLGPHTALAGSDMTRGKVRFTGDGRRTEFRVSFPQPHASEPVVCFNTDLFLKDALRKVSRDGFTVAFETPPPAGEAITVWWMAQE